MHIRVVVSLLGLIGILYFIVPASWAQGGASPVIQREYTVFVELHPPHGKNRDELQKLLKAEGYESFAEGERQVVLVLTEAQIGKLFQARVRFRKVGASASDRIITQPYLEGARIPGRFGKLIRRVYFDPQRG